MPFICERLKTTDISDRTTEIIVSSWRHETQSDMPPTYGDGTALLEGENKPHYTYDRQSLGIPDWIVRCGPQLLFFEYGQVNIFSYFFAIDGASVGSHALTSSFMRGVFIARPTFPWYKGSWDVSILLNYLRKRLFERWTRNLVDPSKGKTYPNSSFIKHI